MNLTYMIIGLIGIVLTATVAVVWIVASSRRATDLGDIAARLESVEKSLTRIP